MYRNDLKIFFLGIGGIGMSGIAEVLKSLNYNVMGSDVSDSDTLRRLRSLDIPVFVGHNSERIKFFCPDVVVASSAITPDNLEILEAKKLGIPIIRRQTMLAELMRLKYGIAVSGAHGKTTTTSLIAHVLHKACFDPTIVLGGRLKKTGQNAALGGGPFIVVEADESDRSFLSLSPSIAVVTNIDKEHLNSYDNSFEALKNAFVAFMEKVPFYGLAVYCSDDPIVSEISKRVDRRKISYGLSEYANIRARDVQIKKLGLSAEVYAFRDHLGSISLNIPGIYNLRNALASVVVGRELGIGFTTIASALSTFGGIERRFEIKLEINGLCIIEDYAHHPTEIKITLETLINEYPAKKKRLVFQPHRYSRVSSLFDEFTTCFNGIDELIILPTYAASEPYLESGDSSRLFERILNLNSFSCRMATNYEELLVALKENIEEPQVIAFVGAGDIGKLVNRFVQELKDA